MKKIVSFSIGMMIIALMITGCESEDIQKIRHYLRRTQEKTEELMEEQGIDVDGAKQKVKDKVKEEFAKQDGSGEPGILSGVEDVALTDLTGRGTDYAFIYDGEPYLATYTPDNWEIKDSYKITNAMDMAVICQALINEHPIHGRDMVSYRTCDDMAYEWIQHNVAYGFLQSRVGNPSDGSGEQTPGAGTEYDSWLNSVKNVDLDPKDQGKSYRELYEDRTGKKFDIQSFLD